MTTIFNDAGEQEIRSVVLYVNASKLYFDAEHKNVVTKAQALELCLKKMVLILDTNMYYTVTSFKEGTVSYGTDKTVTIA